MDAKGTIDSIIELDGVYGAFFSSHDDKSIIAKVPEDYPAEVLQAIAFHGEETMEQFREEVQGCNEVRMDMGHISILMFLMPGGIMFAIVYKPKIIELLRDAVFGLCQAATREHKKSLLLTARIPPPQLPGGRTIVELGDHTALVPVIPQVVTPKKIERPRYINETAIGEGGTAVVYKAYDTRLKRQVALKRYRDNENAEAENDYRSELETASRIQHPNVVSTYDADGDDFSKFMVMELINGEDLEKRIARGALNLNQFTEMAIQALEGVAATHAGGLLHLDLKPSNLMLANLGGDRMLVKVIDYGRARILGESPRGGGLSGSIHYASPEYLSEIELDERADLYALGCSFYWALSGKRPFEGDNILVIMAAHIRHDVVDLREIVPGIPDWLADWVMSLIECDREMRPRTAEEALDALMQRGMPRKGVREVAHA